MASTASGASSNHTAGTSAPGHHVEVGSAFCQAGQGEASELIRAASGSAAEASTSPAHTPGVSAAGAFSLHDTVRRIVAPEVCVPQVQRERDGMELTASELARNYLLRADMKGVLHGGRGLPFSIEAASIRDALPGMIRVAQTKDTHPKRGDVMLKRGSLDSAKAILRTEHAALREAALDDHEEQRAIAVSRQAQAAA